MRKPIIFLAPLLLCATMAQAQEVVMRADIYTTYQSHESAVGQSLDDFMLQVAPDLAQITADTGFEACAAIGQNEEGRYGVTITSSQSQMACILRPEIIPVGFAPTKLSIHSHPDSTSPKREMTTMDKQLTQAMGRRPLVRSEEASRRNFGKARRTTNFSKDDIENGPGYLVTGDKVLFQEGFGTTRRVGRFKK